MVQCCNTRTWHAWFGSAPAALLDSAVRQELACDQRSRPTEQTNGADQRSRPTEQRRWRRGGDGEVVEMVVAVKNGAVMAMAVMAIEPSCKGQRGPVHVNIKVSDRRGTCSAQVFTRWFEPGSPSSAKIASVKPESPLVPVGHSFVPTSFNMHPCSRALEGLSPPARQQLVESRRRPRRSQPPRLPTGKRSRRSIASALQRRQLLLRHRRDRPRTKGQPFGTKGQRSATKGRDYWTKGQDPILGSEIPRSPYDLLYSHV